MCRMMGGSLTMWLLTHLFRDMLDGASAVQDDGRESGSVAF